MPENICPYILSSFVVLHSVGLSLVPATMSWSFIVHTFISMLSVRGKKKKKKRYKNFINIKLPYFHLFSFYRYYEAKA